VCCYCVYCCCIYCCCMCCCCMCCCFPCSCSMYVCCMCCCCTYGGFMTTSLPSCLYCCDVCVRVHVCVCVCVCGVCTRESARERGRSTYYPLQLTSLHTSPHLPSGHNAHTSRQFRQITTAHKWNTTHRVRRGAEVWVQFTLIAH